jgi:hypothetical protein
MTRRTKMGYYSHLRGGWAVHPPLKWSEIEPHVELTEAGRRTVWLQVEEKKEDHEEGVLITKVCHHVAVYEGESIKAYDTEQEVREIAEAFPDHEFRGYMQVEGEENGDMWRMYIVKGKAIKHTVEALWPDPPEGATFRKWDRP